MSKPFILKQLKKDDFSSVEQKISFKGIELVMQVKKDPSFERAMALINTELFKPKPLSKEVLADRAEFGTQEAILFTIGEYLIKEWNIVDSNSNGLPINGDNFMALCEQVGDIDDIQEFISLVFSTFTKLSNDFTKKRFEIKKKQ